MVSKPGTQIPIASQQNNEGAATLKRPGRPFSAVQIHGDWEVLNSVPLHVLEMLCRRFAACEQQTMTNFIEAFRTAITSAGLTPPEFISGDGKIHRYSTDNKPSHKNGWYFLHMDGIPWGQAGSWDVNGGDPVCQWCAKNESTMTQAERDTHRMRVNLANVQRDAVLFSKHETAAAVAQEILDATEPADPGHGYLAAKGISTDGARQIEAVNAHRLCKRLSPELTGPLLVIPIRNIAGELRSLQFITENGVKRPVTGGEKQGCYFAIGVPKGQIIICEGFATGASLAQCTGDAVAVAFDAGNLYAVAVALHVQYPTLKIVIAADDDHQQAGNPGLTKATAAAHAVGGILAVPTFAEGRPGNASDFNDLHQLAGPEAVKAGIDSALESAAQNIATGAVVTGAASINAAWEPPTEIVSDLPLAPAFEANVLLPKVLADYVQDEADRMPCSPDFIAVALIVCLGSVIGAGCALKPKRRDDWLVVPNTWGGVVGWPSSKKTPALSKATQFIDRLEAREAAKKVDAKREFEAEQAAFDANQSAVKANMKKLATGKPNPLKMAAAIDDLKAIEPPEEPHARRYKSNDASVQKLCDLEARNPRGLMVFRDELVGLLASWESEGHEGDRAYYLEGWNGTGSYNSDRIGRGEQFVKNHCLSILGGIQPDKMETYLSHIASNLDNDGRVQRFQVMVFPEPVPWQWRDRHPVEGVREAVRDIFDRLSEFDPVQAGACPADDFVKLPHFYFDDAAQEIFIEWCSDLNLNQIVKEHDPMMKQHLGKFEKLFCSLALILHLSEGNKGPVKADSALRAAAWCEYLAGHARRIYSMVEGARVSTANMLLRRIQEGKLETGFTVRTIRQKNWSGATSNMQIEAALSTLEAHHCVRGIDSVNGGRPTTTYEVNPALIRSAV